MLRGVLCSRKLLQISRCNHQRQRNQSSFIQKLRENQLPLWAGLSVIGFFHYRRIRKRHDQEISDALEQGKLTKIEENVPWKVKKKYQFVG